MSNPNGRPRPHGWRVGNHGYRMMWSPGHQSANPQGYVLEHIMVAANVLGRRLPAGAQVHHINGDKLDNRPENLVICEDRAYHMLLHQRQDAIRACGHPTWRKCARCSEYADPTTLIAHGARAVVHRACNQRYQRERYARRTRRMV